MRFRLFMASFAAACALALCAVPAFASESEVLDNGDYGTVTVTYYGFEGSPDFSAIPYGIYRTTSGLTLVASPPAGFSASSSYPYWEYRDGSSWVSSDVSAFAYDITSIGLYERRFTDSNGHGITIQFNVASLGDVGNSEIGLFGMITQGISNAVEWMSTWLNGILGQPVLLFFCIALGLLTIGISVFKRLIAVRA